MLKTYESGADKQSIVGALAKYISQNKRFAGAAQNMFALLKDRRELIYE